MREAAFIRSVCARKLEDCMICCSRHAGFSVARRLTILCLLFGSLSPAQAAKSPQNVFERAAESVVMVFGEPDARGSGVVVAESKIVTNCHVIEDAKSIAVRHRAKRFSARLVAADWHKDLCILEAAGMPSRSATIRAELPRVGDRVYSVGAPQGLELSLGEGLISGLREFANVTIQTTAPISPGSSGGGLFDDQARLIGITTSYHKSGQVLNFAVPASYIRPLLSRPQPSSNLLAQDRPRREERQIDLESEADRFISTRDWEGLGKFATMLTSKYPSESMAWILLSVVHHQLGNQPESIKAAREAIRLDPQGAAGWLRAGIAYAANGRPEEARQAFGHVRELRGPEFVPAGAYAAALILLGKEQQAFEICGEDSQHIKHDTPNKLVCSRIRATVNMKARKYAEAAQDLAQHLELLPPPNRTTTAYVELAIAYGESGQNEKAAQALESALKIDDKHDRAWGGLGLARYKLGQYRSAVIALLEATRLNPGVPRYWEMLAQAYAELGDTASFSRAVTHLRKLDAGRAESLAQRYKRRPSSRRPARGFGRALSNHTTGTSGRASPRRSR